MAGKKLITRMLRLKGILAVKDFALTKRAKELILWVKPYKNGCRCPSCNRRCRIIRIKACREWFDLTVGGQLLSFLSPKGDIMSYSWQNSGGDSMGGYLCSYYLSFRICDAYLLSEKKGSNPLLAA